MSFAYTQGGNVGLRGRVWQPFVPVQGRRGSKRQYQGRGAASLQVVNAAELGETIASTSPQSLTAIAGVVGVAGIAALTYFFNNQQTSAPKKSQPSRKMSAPGRAERQDAVLVFGATGKTGQKLVKQLLEEGRQVVAAVRSTEKSNKVFADLLKEHKGRLLIEGAVDVTDKASFSSKGLWQGVAQAVLCVGPIFGQQDNGEMGYNDGMTPEKVDAEGVSNVVEALKQNLQPLDRENEKVVVPMKSEKDLADWERIDDVIMGGQSSSKLEPSGDGKSAVWSGELILEGGGFCGTRNKSLNLDLSEYDGIQIRVKGDGQIYKINLKTADKTDDPENTYAATFATSEGDWQTIKIPFREFVAVTRAKTNPDAPPLDTGRIGQIGFRLSRFDFNNLPNPAYKPGPFRLEFEEGIYGFKNERPSLVLVSSCGVERNAIIGDDVAARKQDIPIVQLNPGGILNFKYKGEMAVRTSGLPYSILRPVGLTTEKENEPFVLEASQGDNISGKISRAEVATVISAALQTPASKGKTVEVRRSEAEGSQGKTSSARQLEQLFLSAVEDWKRPKRNLPPLPMVSDPPPPPSKERVDEILADPRVKEVEERSSKSAAENGAPSQNGAKSGGASAKAQSSQNGTSSNGSSNGSSNAKGEAKEWIADWRERTKA